MSSDSNSFPEQASPPGGSLKRQISSSYSSVTTHCWPIADFKKQWMEARNNGQKNLFGDSFSLMSRPFIRFALMFQSTKEVWSENWFGLIMKDLGGNETVKIDFKHWFQNGQGQKFNEMQSSNETFGKTGNGRGWTGLNKEASALLTNLYENHETLYVCCQITDLSSLVEDDHEKFFMNQWTLFEREKHDAIIRVGKTEFKILKFPFIAQSEVFDRMLSANFKEGQTNVVDVKNISEKTMKVIIKWVYTGQIEENNLDGDLFEAADKYDFKILKKLCVSRLRITITKDTVIWRLKLAVMHNENQLKESALFCISQMSGVEMAKMFTDPDWTKFSRKNIAISDEIINLISDKMSELELE